MSAPSADLAEDVDAVALAEGDDSALDVLALAVAEAGALALALPVQRVDVGDLDVEDLLDRDLDLGLVGQRVHLERVLVLVQQPVALLRDHGGEQDVAGVVEHQTSSLSTVSADSSSTSPLVAAPLADLPRAGPARKASSAPRTKTTSSLIRTS